MADAKWSDPPFIDLLPPEDRRKYEDETARQAAQWEAEDERDWPEEAAAAKAEEASETPPSERSH